MVLSDRTIMELLESGEIEIDPLDDPVVQIQPCSVDLRLAPNFVRVAPRINTHFTVSRFVIIEPGEFILGSTVERVRVPDYLLCTVDGRSSIGRRGIFVHITAGMIDPGFDGYITLEILNATKEAVSLEVGSRVCQIKFQHLDRPCWRPYGMERGSKYANQREPVPVPSRRDG